MIPHHLAQFDLSSACIATLVNGLDLLAPRQGQAEILAQVATGSHRLLSYALEFWVEHCLLYVTLAGCCALQSLLAQLHDKHLHLVHMLSHDTRNSLACALPVLDATDARAEALAGLPVHTIIRDVLQVRQWISQQNCENGTGKFPAPLIIETI